jgi:DNA-binding NarL/FixJ family response regulator
MSGRSAILIVDTDSELRTRLANLLEGAGFHSIHAVAGLEAVALARRERPWLAVVDLRLPDISGYEVCSELREEFGDELAIILVSADRTEPMDRAAGFLVGADDYFAKPFDSGELLARVRRLFKRASSPRPTSAATGAAPGGDLTPRELEILTLLSAGKRPREIAAALFISEKTVSSHLQRVLTKLDVRSRTEAVAVAYREGLIRPPKAALFATSN